MFYKFFTLVFLTFLIATENKNFENKQENIILKNKDVAIHVVSSKVEQQFHTIFSDTNNLPSFECFDSALKGFNKLKNKKEIENTLLTIIDFSFSSNKKRLWVIDLAKNTVLYHSLVAHGKNSGEEFATEFSNKQDSYKSSLGFYLTGELYEGKHGKSLKLDGIEEGINDNARNRAIVIHGADYVSQNFINNNGRLGRSLGCPALPVELNSEIIEKIKNKSLIFIYHPLRNKSIKNRLTS